MVSTHSRLGQRLGDEVTVKDTACDTAGSPAPTAHTVPRTQPCCLYLLGEVPSLSIWFQATSCPTGSGVT